jgi:hypothetical protein
MKRYFNGSRVSLEVCYSCKGEGESLSLSMSERPLCLLCLESQGKVSRVLQSQGLSIRSERSLRFYSNRGRV